MMVRLEETYPYLLRNAFRESVFYQLSFGNITTEDLVSQAVSYLTHWRPHVIVVQSGLSDCRPEAFSDAEKAVIKRLPERIFGWLQRRLNDPSIIRWRQVHRVTPESFRKTSKKLKMIFAKSKILWLEICAAPEYEKERPGVGCRISEYNAIIADIYAEGIVPVKESLLRVDGFNRDCIHWLPAAHRAVAEALIQRIADQCRTEVPCQAISSHDA